MKEPEGSITAIENEYVDKEPVYKKFCEELTIQLNELLVNARVSTAFPIERRVKSLDSVIKECKERKKCPSSIEEIKDLAGIRIILLFSPDLDKVCNIIENVFTVLHKEDKETRLGESQFGYKSIHYDAIPDEAWFGAPTLKNLRGLKCEIQVRTATQHIWAASSHILQYKRERDVPIPIQRSINRAAALLEVVDLEFERVLNERQKYIETSPLSIDDYEPLNTDTLRILLDELLPPQNKSDVEEYSMVLDELEYLNCNDQKSMREIIGKHISEIKKSDAELVVKFKQKEKDGLPIIPQIKKALEKDAVMAHTGMVRNALRREFGSKYEKYLASPR
jgi:ppGpp synthetase/RelA/SpoT-type nucleotidyltranferase